MDKKHIWRYFGNYIFFLAAFTLFELLLRFSTTGPFEFTGFLFSVLFNMILILVFCSVMNFVTGKAHVVVNNIFLSIVTVLYASQIIYYHVFGTFYNTDSMFNAGQITQFWVVILKSIWDKLVFILLCALPLFAYNIFVRKSVLASTGKSLMRKTRADTHWLNQLRQLTLGISAAVYLVMFTAFMPFAVDPFTSYSMYFGQHDYEFSIRRTGLLSTLQIDALKVFVTEDASGALTALEELRDTEEIDYTIFQPEPEIPAATPRPPVDPGVEPDDGEPGEDEPGNIEPDEPIVYGYNVMTIDFNRLIEEETNENVRALTEYFRYAIPSQKNEYTGMFEGYNLIKFVAEGFSPFAVREDLTPTLYKLVHEGFHFTNFYTPSWGVSTSDGEYVACTGLLPKSGVWSFSRSSNNYLPFVMGNQLRSIGYNTVAYHNHTHTYYNRHTSHPNMGYDYKGVGNGLVLPRVVWPNSDLEMMQATMDEYIYSQPFHAYYMTVSGHLEYNFGGNAMAARNREAVEHLPYSNANKAYIACHIELDKALEYMLQRLNEAGIAENTVIVLSTDHYPYGLDGTDGISEFLGHTVDRNFELYENNLIIYAQGMEPVTVDKLCSSLDIIPTISNLMGLEFDSRFLMGRDILSNSDPLVIFMNRSFITDMGYRIRGGDFVPNPDVIVDDDYGDYIRAVIDAKFSVSTSILDLDYYRKVFG